jgi:hypothetical protein
MVTLLKPARSALMLHRDQEFVFENKNRIARANRPFTALQT